MPRLRGQPRPLLRHHRLQGGAGPERRRQAGADRVPEDVLSPLESGAPAVRGRPVGYHRPPCDSSIPISAATGRWSLLALVLAADQPGLLAPRSADLPPRHRRVRHPLQASTPPAQFFRGVSLLLAAAVGVAFVSRRGQELPGLLRQRRHPAAGRAALLGRRPPLPGAPLLAVRGPAERRDPRQAPEGAHRRREADRHRGQHRCSRPWSASSS